MASFVYYVCFIGLIVQAVTSQFNGNYPIASFNNLPLGANSVSGLAGPNLGSLGLGGPSLLSSRFTGPGLAGNNFVGSGLGPNGFIGSGSGSSGLLGPATGGSLTGNGLINGFIGSGSGISGLGSCGGSRTSSGTFAVTSTSPISPTGVTILAENLSIEGPLSVGGQLPFLGTVGLEGNLATTGTGAVSYGCGSGDVGMTSDAANGLTGQYGSASQYGVGLTGPGFGGSLAGVGPNLAGCNPGLGTFGAGIGPGLF